MSIEKHIILSPEASDNNTLTTEKKNDLHNAADKLVALHVEIWKLLLDHEVLDARQEMFDGMNDGFIYGLSVIYKPLAPDYANSDYVLSEVDLKMEEAKKLFKDAKSQRNILRLSNSGE
jgi:hypothetical protein